VSAADLLALKPCPFCGGKAVLTGSLVEPPLNHVICTECPVGTRGFMHREAVKFWNTRARATQGSGK
jgi:Lar family restriction alleviation protein